jgi:hypothetical protein
LCGIKTTSQTTTFITLERKIKHVRIDCGGEYFSNLFTLFYEEHGIIHERMSPYSHQSNRVAERKNCTLTDLVNTMLDTSRLSKEWWGEAILTACHVLNRVSIKNKEITPFKKWEKKRVNLSYLCALGCLTKVNVTINKKRKLEPKTVDCIFIGYVFHNIGYRFLIIKSRVPDMHIGTIMDSKDATFFEDIFSMRGDYYSTSQKSIINDEPTKIIEHNEQTLVKNLWSDNETSKKSKRQRTAKSFNDNFIVYLMDDTLRIIE